nr:unknown [Medicago truncatula]
MNRRANLSLSTALFKVTHSFHKSPIPISPIPFPPPTSNFHSFSKFTPTHFSIQQNLRNFSNGSSNFDHNKEVDEINLKFAEAREEIEMALESKETVYFNEEAECARAAVNEVLSKFDALLAKLPEKERGALQRSMGLKIEQLKAEILQLDE